MDNDYVDPNLAYYQQQRMLEQQDFLRFQLDVREELQRFKYDLLGYEYKEETNTWEPSSEKARMINEKGADSILTFLRPRVTRIFSLSNTDGDDVDKRCIQFINGLTYMLCRHKDSYEIPSYQIMDNIIDLADDIFRATVLKSIGGWEGDSIRKGHTTVESRNLDSGNKSKPFGFGLPFSN